MSRSTWYLKIEILFIAWTPGKNYISSLQWCLAWFNEYISSTIAWCIFLWTLKNKQIHPIRRNLICVCLQQLFSFCVSCNSHLKIKMQSSRKTINNYALRAWEKRLALVSGTLLIETFYEWNNSCIGCPLKIPHGRWRRFFHNIELETRSQSHAKEG